MYARFAGMFMIQHKEIRTMACRPEPNLKTCLMTGSAPFVVPQKRISKKKNNCLEYIHCLFLSVRCPFLSACFFWQKGHLLLRLKKFRHPGSAAAGGTCHLLATIARLVRKSQRQPESSHPLPILSWPGLVVIGWSMIIFNV